MKFPPFCPNDECSHHWYEPDSGTPIQEPGEERQWFAPAGYYSTKAFGRVRRFRCRSCGRYFSEQTFSLDYFNKRPISFETVFRRIVGGSGVRTISREIGVSHQIVLNRISRLARQGIAVHAVLASLIGLDENLAADGFESFVDSQYEPNNIHLLVGSRSQFLYGFDYAHLRRKGRMSEEQKQERERRYECRVRDRISISESFSRIVSMIEDLIATRPCGEEGQPERTVLFTDKKIEYVRCLNTSEILKELKRRESFTYVRISSRKARTITNRLFPVNYMDRQVRKDNANQVRETVQFSRNVNNCLDRMSVYQLYHNYCKPFRIGRPEEEKLRHGEVAGIEREKIDGQLTDLFTRRRFFSRLRLSCSQLRMWFRMVGNVGKLTGGFYPKYVWM